MGCHRRISVGCKILLLLSVLGSVVNAEQEVGVDHQERIRSQAQIGQASLGQRAAVLDRPSASEQDLKPAPSIVQPLSFEARVNAQEAVERAMFAHHVSSQGEQKAALEFDEFMPEDAIRSKVIATLRRCDALEKSWGKNFSGEDLQQEINRMVRESLMPGRLQELFDALDNDPHQIAECLARPILAENLIRDLFSKDEVLQGSVESRAVGEWAGVHGIDDLNMLSGMISERVWILTTEPGEVAGGGPEPGSGVTSLNQEGWEKLQIYLLGQLGFNEEGTESTGRIEAGLVGPLGENDYSHFGVVVNEVSAREIRITRVVWEKEDFGLWWEQNERNFAARVDEPSLTYTLPDIASHNKVGRSGGDSWTPTAVTGAPAARSGHLAVWTGSKMIVWGGRAGSSYFKSGGQYDPATNSWTATNTASAPDATFDVVGAWESDLGRLFIWEGVGGGIYSPGSDSWVATCDTSGDPCNVPTSRYGHTMIPRGYGSRGTIWGGMDSVPVRTGAGLIYDGDVSTSWVATDTTDPDCPTARLNHTAVAVVGWGDEDFATMIVWGGDDWGGDGQTDTGGSLRLEDFATDPSDWWKPVSTDGAPAGRENHAAVVVGSPSVGDRMLVWGGQTAGADEWNKEGGIYDVGSDTWSLMSKTNSPIGRRYPTVVWTGHEMIVWGGDQILSSVGGGGRYSLADDVWYSTEGSGAPSARTEHTAVWTGEGMIVWGGTDGDVDDYRTGRVYTSCWRDPTLGSATVTATDSDACVDSGIVVSWDQDIYAWGDYGNTAQRNYVVMRDGQPIWWEDGCGEPLPYGTTSCTNDFVTPGVSYTYTVTYENACGTTVTTEASAEVIDQTSTVPTVTVICTAIDADGCALGSGIDVSWPQNPGGGWGDNDSGDRMYRVWRRDNVFASWEAIGTQIVYGTTTYHDAATTPGYLYSYKVKYINGCGDNADTPSTTNVQDKAGSDPSVTGAILAEDAEFCNHSGNRVTWPQDPDDWGDNGDGERLYRVRRSTDGVTFNPVGQNISYPATSWVDTGANPDQLYHYQVRFKNGCDLFVDSGSDTATDAAGGVAPIVTVNSDSSDPDHCIDGGIQVSWDQDPEAWGDSDHGTRTYDVLRDGSALAVGTGLAYGSTSFTDTTGENGTGYLYQVRYNNGCGISAATAGGNSNDRPTAPSPPVNNTAADIDDCAFSGVLVSWNQDPDGNWGDGGGTHTYEVMRDGISLQSGIAYGTTDLTDDTAVQGTEYLYTVKYVNCGGLYAETAGTTATDNTAPAAPAEPTVRDASACYQSGVWISLTEIPGASGYDLRVDGTTMITDVTVPFLFDPGDVVEHTYEVRATSAECTGAWSAATSFTDVIDPAAEFCDGFELGDTSIWSETVP